MARHKHADVIHAWADGAQIQQFGGDGWYDDSDTPEWFEDAEYRIKPKIVKREGWVNIYRAPGGDDTRNAYGVHTTEESAKAAAASNVVATLKIEWEEEE